MKALHNFTSVGVVVGLVIGFVASEYVPWTTQNRTADLLPGVTATIGRDYDLGMVTYKDGAKFPRDGIAVQALTWPDYQKARSDYDWPGKAPLEEDFPLLLFFNATGFDASGQPVAVRRASDGRQIYADPGPGPVRLVVPDGTSFKVWGPTGVTPKVLTQAEWARDYMSLDVGAPTLPDKGKSGLHVTAASPGGPTGTTPQAGVMLYVTTTEALHFLNEGVKIDSLAHWMTDKDGKVDIPLPAGHPYVLFTLIDGKPVGNAVAPGAFPAVDTKDGWVDYEFRLPAKQP